MEKYFSLKCKGGNAYHASGWVLRRGGRTVSIGETADCDIRYEAGDYEAECYAVIVRNDDGRSWRLVRRSPHVDITVQGKGTVGYVVELSDGDIIHFGGQPMALQFNSHREAAFPVVAWGMVSVAVVMVAGLLAWNLLLRESPLSEEDVAYLEESVYSVQVDSVRHLLVVDGTEQLVHPTKVLADGGPRGTAFLTSDGLLLTARHCVEYWLGQPLKLTERISMRPDDDVVRWSVETETFNQLHEEQGDSAMLLRVFFSIYDFTGERQYAFSSTDPQVHMDKRRDGIYLMADFSREYYYRSIRPYFSDREMALGDVLWIDGLAEKGGFRLASAQQLRTLKRGTELMVYGFPTADMPDRQACLSRAVVKQPVASDHEVLVVEASINHGFSGGPLLARIHHDIVAVGVVSRVDSVSGGLFKWAVPVASVNKDDSEHENK